MQIKSDSRTIFTTFGKNSIAFEEADGKLLSLMPEQPKMLSPFLGTQIAKFRLSRKSPWLDWLVERGLGRYKTQEPGS